MKYPIEEQILVTLGSAYRIGLKIEEVFLSGSDFAQLKNALGNYARLDNKGRVEIYIGAPGRDTYLAKIGVNI